MSRATKQYHDTDFAEQLSLLPQEELAELLCPSASGPRQVEITSHKTRRQGVEERFIQRAGAIQPKLPGL